MLKSQFFIKKSILYIRFFGELDQKSADSNRVRVSELLSLYKIKYVIINCKNLTFMDSSGIGFILGRYNEIKENKGLIILCELNSLVNRIVNISGLSRICMIKATEDEASRYVEGIYGKVYQM